jgi:RNA polymerase primary sigma factor
MAKKRGYVTMDEFNAVLPSEEVHLRADRGHDGDALRHGHQRRRGRRAGEEARPKDGRTPRRAQRTGRGPAPAVAAVAKKEPTDRTDDPVRMYLREMGSVELLSREGEIAIAKRIEAGRETMIAGCAKAR